VLFDFGGVLTTSPFEAFARYERERGLPEGYLRTVNATNPDSNAWARLERSEIGIEAFDEAFAMESAELGHTVSGQDVLALLGGDLRPAMVEALRRCRERFLTGLLTNNFVIGGTRDEGHESMRAVLELFTVVVESSKVGCRKPDPRFFEIACDRLGIEPSEAVFLDDLGINLKPARAMGMTTIKVLDGDRAIAELEDVVGFSLG
jgi:putative hydrolase of the HAD superfamily